MVSLARLLRHSNVSVLDTRITADCRLEPEQSRCSASRSKVTLLRRSVSGVVQHHIAVGTESLRRAGIAPLPKLGRAEPNLPLPPIFTRYGELAWLPRKRSSVAPRTRSRHCALRTPL